MVESRITGETLSSAGTKLAPNEAVERVNAALRRLVKNHQRELELIARAQGKRYEVGRTLAATWLEGFQFTLVQFPLRHLRKLTERQRQIAISVAVGMTNKEVGRRLAIKPATVSSHLRVIYKKLHVDSRPELLLRVLAGRL